MIHPSQHESKYQYRPITQMDLWQELESRPSWNQHNETCPTCKGTGSYLYQGDTRICEKDLDGDCIQYKLLQRYELANIPPMYQKIDWHSDFISQPDAKKEIDGYLSNLSGAIQNGVGWFMYSKNLGTGKTTIGTHVLKEFAKKDYACWFQSWFRLKEWADLSVDDQRKLRKRLDTYQVVLIDDVTIPVSDRQGNYYASVLESVIRHRVEYDLVTIVTTNMTPEEFEDSYNRVYSLLARKSFVLPLDNIPDARLERGVNEFGQALLKGETIPLS